MNHVRNWRCCRFQGGLGGHHMQHTTVGTVSAFAFYKERFTDRFIGRGLARISNKRHLKAGAEVQVGKLKESSSIDKIREFFDIHRNSLFDRQLHFCLTAWLFTDVYTHSSITVINPCRLCSLSCLNEKGKRHHRLR